MTNGTTSPHGPHTLHESSKGYDESFVMLYHSQLDRLVGEPYALAVFVALMRRANREQGDRCFPSLNTIADDAGVSRSSVWRSIQKLVEVGLLHVAQRKTESGDPTSNIYTILRPHVPKNEGGTSENRPSAPTEQTPVSEGHPNHSNSNKMKSEQEGYSNPRSKRSTTVPSEVSDSARQWALGKGLTEQQIGIEADKFLDYHAAKGSTYKDWNAAFRNWINNGISRGWITLPRTKTHDGLSDAARSGRLVF